MSKSPNQPYENSSKLSRKEIVFNNFIGGIFWALGATVGISLLFALLGLLGKFINIVPFVGTFVSQIVSFVMDHNSTIQK